jgi:lipopolysaccharide/colanic/teichoic acid biosynthesis glycosyltransferase
MNSPANDMSGTAIAVEPKSAVLARAEAGTSAPHHGKVHAVPVHEIGASPGWLTETIHRGVEIVVALIALALFLPVILIVAALIRCDSPGPALFFQKRLARSVVMRGRDLGGRADLAPPPGGYQPDTFYYVPRYFTFVKFRTMYYDALSRFPDLYAYKFRPEDFHQRHFKTDNDPRVTRVGQFLRKITVDELPNLWCLLVGDMRLVGPRPEIPEVLQYYTPEEMYKFTCKPGITGLAQINGRGLLRFGETLAWDMQYVRTRSVGLDLKIILVTLKYVITRRGAF